MTRSGRIPRDEAQIRWNGEAAAVIRRGLLLWRTAASARRVGLGTPSGRGRLARSPARPRLCFRSPRASRAARLHRAPAQSLPVRRPALGMSRERTRRPPRSRQMGRAELERLRRRSGVCVTRFGRAGRALGFARLPMNRVRLDGNRAETTVRAARRRRSLASPVHGLPARRCRRAWSARPRLRCCAPWARRLRLSGVLRCRRTPSSPGPRLRTAPEASPTKPPIRARP